jgi:hypothetical protein
MFAGEASEVLDATDAAYAQVGAAQRELLALLAEADRSDAWVDQGARDMAHFVSIRYGISCWKARRWISAGYALEELPEVAAALRAGELSLDKVVELTRFATAETESRLIRWARGVSVGAIRHRGDLAARSSITETLDAEQARFLDWWYLDDGRRLGLRAELPAAQGAVVVKAIERMAADVPAMPEEDDAGFVEARRADALVALCSAALAADPDPDRATVVVHVRADAMQEGIGGCEIEDGPVISQRTARRLLCSARVQTVVEDDRGEVIGLGRMSREPSSWMVRQVRYRDRECRFPGCGTRAFTEAHHIRWWRHGGRTDLDNLVLICSFHHRLVHEYGWSIAREPDGQVSWFREDGTGYRAGPSPGMDPDEQTDVLVEPALAGVG